MLLFAHNTGACPLPGAMVPSRRVPLSSSPVGSPLQPAIPLLRALPIAGEKILKTELTPSASTPRVFLIAGVCRTFAAAPLSTHHLLLITRHCISNRYTKLLEIELTRSQQTRKHFLITTICPTFTPAPHPTHHSSLTTRDSLTQFLFDTNEVHKIVVPMKTKEKRVSIRYKWALGSMGDPACAPCLSVAPAPPRSAPAGHSSSSAWAFSRRSITAMSSRVVVSPVTRLCWRLRGAAGA